jgi:hypothetical protein
MRHPPSALTLPRKETVIAVADEPIHLTTQEAGLSIDGYALEYEESGRRWMAYVASQEMVPEEPEYQPVSGFEDRSGMLVQGVMAWVKAEKSSDQSGVIYQKFIDSMATLNVARVQLARWSAARQVRDSLRLARGLNRAIFVELLPGPILED